jgi:hypothetical protein
MFCGSQRKIFFWFDPGNKIGILNLGWICLRNNQPPYYIPNYDINEVD